LDKFTPKSSGQAAIIGWLCDLPLTMVMITSCPVPSIFVKIVLRVTLSFSVLLKIRATAPKKLPAKIDRIST
jgi:hypothetical protein